MFFCTRCEKQIPEKRTSRNTTVLLDWGAYGVEGMFCSQSCAMKNLAEKINAYV
jgi:hypothetical protein